MAEPVIIYNASTGSDTAASGAGPGTALTGSTATNGSGNVVNLDGSPDLTNVATDGSHALWANIAGANRRLSKITAKDNGAKTVTTDDLLSLGAGVSWAIGGKRQTLNHNTSRRDWADYKAGWTAEFEAGTYDTPVTIDVSGSLSGLILFRAASGASPTLRSTANLHHFEGSYKRIRGLTLTTNSGTKTGTAAFRPVLGDTFANFFTDCVIDGLQYGFLGFNRGRCVAERCEFKNLVAEAVNSTGGNYDAVASISGCWIHDCGGGLDLRAGSAYPLKICDTIIESCTGDGIRFDMDRTTGLYLLNVILWNNGGDGLDLSNGTIGAGTTIYMQNSIIAENGGYGVRGQSGIEVAVPCADYNAFFDNTSGARLNFPTGDNDVTLSADPFNAAASGDFSLTNDGGGGADCRAAGFPGVFPGGLTTGYRDIGVQHEDAGGGGGPIPYLPMAIQTHFRRW